MDCDDYLFDNLDWDPSYLSRIFLEEFEDLSYLWDFDSVSDSELLEMCDSEGNYSPLVEDISI